MPSVAIVNVYRKTEGITVVAELYREALVKAGFQTDFYQCIEGDAVDYANHDVMVKGFSFPNRYVEKGINRALVFPFLLRKLTQDLVFLSDPWLLNLTMFKNNIVVLVHDLRLSTKYAENTAQSLLFKQVISRLQNVMKIISISNVTRDSLISMGINETKIVVLPHCTGLEIDGRNHISRSLSKIERGEPLNVVYVAHDIHYKQISLFIEIACALTATEKHSKFHFTLPSNQPLRL